MSGEIVKTRFAPSPTGLLHLGNVRTALFNWLMARREGGIFLLRIEDTDVTRYHEEAVTALLEDLCWLGLNWDEGVAQGGDRGPYCQSERMQIYQVYYETLQQRGLAYPCFCTPAELSIVRKTQLASRQPPRYPGTCARLSEDEVDAKLRQGLKPTLRFSVPVGQIIEFNDLVRGPQRFAADDIGDFVIRRADSSAAFFFTNAVDDALMGVTDVLRGEDHLSNTPRQLLLLKALDLRAPRYGHISMVVGNDGTPLAKRHGSLAVRQLRERGYLPMAVNNMLARFGHYYEKSGFMDMEEMVAGFSPSHLGRAPVRFDPSQLDHWQREAVAHADTAELWSWMERPVHQLVPGLARQDFIQAVRANVTMPKEALDWARIVYSEPPEVSAAATEVLMKVKAGFFQHALEALNACPGDFNGFVAKLKERVEERGKGLFLPLRTVLTGRLDGPELATLFPLIGSDRIRQRLQKYLKT